MEFSENLKYLRKSTQFTQKKLADYLGLSANTVCEWEKGRSEPSISTIKKMADIFDVSADYLLGLEDEFGTRIPAVPAGAAGAMGDTLTAQERELLNKFRELSPGLKEVALITLRSLAGEEINENELRFKIRK